MFTKEQIKQQLRALGVPQDRVVLVHSSLRAVGETEGRGEGFLDALIEHCTADGGLLCIPTHTWAFGSREFSLDMTVAETCVQPVRPVRHSLPTVSALRNALCQLTEHTTMGFGNSGAHGSHCTLCCLPSEASGEGGAVQVRTSPYKSVFPRPQYRLCAMYSASHPLSVFFLKKISLGLQFFLICAIISQNQPK